MPESWESASEEEWGQIQSTIVNTFAVGPRFIQEVLGRVLEAKPPPPVAPEPEQPKMPLQLLAEAHGGEMPSPRREPHPYGLAGRATEWAMTPLAPELPEPVKEAPVIGPGAEFLRGFTAPTALVPAAKWPGTVGKMALGGLALGTAGRGLEEAGAPQAEIGGVTVGPGAVGEVTGMFAPAFPAIARAGARAVTRRLPMKPKPVVPKAEIVAAEETGALRMPGPVAEPEALRTTLEAAQQQQAEAKLVPFVQKIKGILPKRAEALHQHRQRQARKLGEIWERAGRGEITPEEAERLHFGSLKGEVDFPELRELAELFTVEDMHALRLSVVQRAETAGLGRFDLGNAMKALEQLKTTGQLAEHQVDLLTRIFGEGVGRELAALKPSQGKLLGEFWEILGIPRGVQASFDISFPLRQGIMLGPRHPRIWGKGTERAFRGFLKPKWADAENAMILREQAEGILPRTLDITRPGVGPFAARADPLISTYLRRVPGIWRAEASFNVAGNRMRRDLSLSYAKRWTKNAGRALTEAEMDDLGRVANYLSGRGPVPHRLAYVLAQVLYSPRFLTSKPAFLIKMVNPATSNYLRRMMAEELVAFVGMGIGLVSLLKFSGAADVEVNPLSSDWGKIKFGKMRYDIWGGGQQLARYTAQLITGQRKTLGTGELVDADRKWVAARFAMSKLSPQLGIPLDLWRGESYMGEEISAEPGAIKTQIWNRMGPLAAQDIVEAVREEGAKGLLALPALLGAGVLTFETPGEKIVKRAWEEHGVEWVNLGKAERLRLENEDEEIAAARLEQLEAAAKWGSSTSLELRQEHAEFEENFSEYLERPDMTLSEAAGQYRDYVQKQAAKNEERWKDAPESDPRDELDRKVDEYYAEEYPTWGTEAEKDAWYQSRAEMRAADPDLDAALLDLAMLRFKGPTVREFVKRYEAGQALKHQYYQIPRFAVLSLEDGNRVGDILREAQSLVELGKASGLRGAIYMIVQRDGIPDDLAYVALYPQRFQNPERRQFRHEHADELAIFEPLPVDVLEDLIID